jgi:hypothetical protein
LNLQWLRYIHVHNLTYFGTLQSGSQMVQEGALTALASAADSSQVQY